MKKEKRYKPEPGSEVASRFNGKMYKRSGMAEEKKMEAKEEQAMHEHRKMMKGKKHKPEPGMNESARFAGKRFKKGPKEGSKAEEKMDREEGVKSKRGGKRKKNWIQGAIKHPGALHRELGVPEGQKIPASKLQSALHSSNPTERRRANLARTLERISHKVARKMGTVKSVFKK